MGPREIAEAFSGHRFSDAYQHLHDDVRWVLPGHEPMLGKDAVIAACEKTSGHLAGLARTEFIRFVVVADDRAAAVDAIGRYVPHDDGPISVVSSADVYEVDESGRVTTITSYAVEIDSEG